MPRLRLADGTRRFGSPRMSICRFGCCGGSTPIRYQPGALVFVRTSRNAGGAATTGCSSTARGALSSGCSTARPRRGGRGGQRVAGGLVLVAVWPYLPSTAALDGPPAEDVHEAVVSPRLALGLVAGFASMMAPRVAAGERFMTLCSSVAAPAYPR